MDHRFLICEELCLVCSVFLWSDWFESSMKLDMYKWGFWNMINILNVFNVSRKLRKLQKIQVLHGLSLFVFVLMLYVLINSYGHVRVLPPSYGTFTQN